MRGTAILALALALAGCSREPSFDERYAKTEQQLSEKALAIDRDLAAAKEPGAAATPAKRPEDAAAR